jgi:hypothetical protein
VSTSAGSGLSRASAVNRTWEMGCLWPLALVLAVAIGTGVLVGTRLQNGPAAPRWAVVRVIDDGAPCQRDAFAGAIRAAVLITTLQ